MRISAMTAAAVCVVLALVGCSDDGDEAGGSGEITRDQFEADGLAWPFEADTATVRCEPGDTLDAVIVTVDGSEWAANGAAQAAGYRDVSGIQVSDPDIPGDDALVPVGDVISAGQETC